jgi:3',5'-cyclic AMP phosphodiesterase CpdA
LDSFTIAHVSDVHLGNDFFWRSTYRRRWYRNTEDPKLLEGLQNALRKIKPAYVVLSGDIVNKCRTGNFRPAAEKLRKLFADAGISVKDQVLVIPGNHDVRLFPRSDEVFQRLKEFHYFLKEFFSEENVRARKSFFRIVDPGRKLVFYCLDSTLKVHKGVAEGEVGIAQRDWLREENEELKKLRPDFDTFVKIGVVHHHPHPIEAGGQEQFMQLLDAIRVINLFQEVEINIVLHGHKHFPHSLKHYYDEGRHYTVLGAGTATCPVVEEQSGEGNNFNVLTIFPTANLLEVQRWKANNDKEYVPYFPEPQQFPLFKPSDKGYKMEEFRAITRVVDMEGTFSVTHKRLRLVVDSPGRELRNIAFGMSSAPNGEILDFEYDHASIASVKYENKLKTIYEGQLVLHQVLRQRADPIDLWFTCTVRGSLCMQRAKYTEYYPGKIEPIESVDIHVVHPCDLLTLVVEFPKNYRVEPRPAMQDQNSSEFDLKSHPHQFRKDATDNSYTLTVHKPKLHHIYRIVWEVL